jgi:hypothetical protein
MQTIILIIGLLICCIGWVSAGCGNPNESCQSLMLANKSMLIVQVKTADVCVKKKWG